MSGVRQGRRGRLVAASLVGLCLVGVAVVATGYDARDLELSVTPLYTITETGNRVLVRISSPVLY
ncbi:hypothetical protein MTR62_10585 [Novosphingobium sp. 1949]|uniref:Uncharacterized protein n=1 Tax=Novosphingobium organovorum TaxID=2930092 RepID=A0ABT0BEC3_9SPHN|nr:hypothetical protein [Novosphingobium organovorum]MCJ2183134.1 hypothetical protein [Novosphingobium organovorum]